MATQLQRHCLYARRWRSAFLINCAAQTRGWPEIEKPSEMRNFCEVFGGEKKYNESLTLELDYREVE